MYNCCNFSFAKLMQNCSNELTYQTKKLNFPTPTSTPTLKTSNPKISSSPILSLSLSLIISSNFFALYSSVLIAKFSLLTSQENNLSYSPLVKLSLKLKQSFLLNFELISCFPTTLVLCRKQ